MKTLITGASGFVGQFLTERLLRQGQTVAALVYPMSDPMITTARADVRLKITECNVLNRPCLEALIAANCPDVIYHLAAQSLPGPSWQKPEITFEVNVLGTINLFEALRALKLNPVVLVACSSSEYAPCADGRPIAEEGGIKPSSPYAVSKIAADHIARLYHESQGIPVIRVRPFFLIGPRKIGDVLSDFARGIVAVERGLCPDLATGNLEVVRDFLDVRDGVEAMELLAGKGKAGEVYNICSGQGYRLRDLLDNFIALAHKPIRERLDSRKMRPLDEKIKIGNPEKLKKLGWRQSRSIATTLTEILDYWRSVDDRRLC